MSLRPEKIAVLEAGVAPPPGRHAIKAKVASVYYQGAITRLATEADGQALTVAAPSAHRKFAVGEIVTLAWADDAMHLMEGEA